MDVFAYDLNEPDLLQIFLKLAKQGRIRVILDNATLHHASKPKKAKKASAPTKAKKAAKPKSPPPEDQFEALFKKAAKKPAEIQRGKFKRFAHDKVFVVRKKKDDTAIKVLTGSTNFSVTGMYVNSNHILVFNSPDVAETYAQIFDIVWDEGVTVKFNKTPEAAKVFSFSGGGLPEMEITFSPHTKDDATKFLDNLVSRMEQEQKTKDGSILFAVMGVDTGSGPVLPALRELHADEKTFTYGISDSPGDGLRLYTPRQKTGVLVSGKPIGTTLPPPFDQVPQISLGHQVHHKFVVCGFNRDDATLYCGSSNLALGGEQENGDNLITIHDTDIATAFAIDALTLVDHFDFLDRSAKKAKAPATKIKEASKQQQAVNAHWFLSTDDTWASPYYDDDDLRSVDRQLFA
jgi:phosphatidylserine/phosphatidylglycerophosphate/cardiolipin synthase-like enzyme